MNVDQQVPFRVYRDYITDLLDKCNKVLADHSKAEELLPTMDGFFFGSTEYDDYYFDDVEEVKNFIVDTLLPQFDNLRDGEKIMFDIWY